MPDTARPETTHYPFTAFNFSFEIDVPPVSSKVCSGFFSECDGLEMTMEAKTIKEGGNNARLIRLTGMMGYGQLTLKRGMTENFDLWRWFSAVTTDPGLRADGHVVLFAADGQTERARFLIERCVPVKLKAPPLNGKDGMVAIEEFQVAYETLSLETAGGARA